MTCIVRGGLIHQTPEDGDIWDLSNDPRRSDKQHEIVTRRKTLDYFLGRVIRRMLEFEYDVDIRKTRSYDEHLVGIALVILVIARSIPRYDMD